MIKTSANVPIKGGKTGKCSIVGQSAVPNKYRNIKTTVSLTGRTHDGFSGGKPSHRKVIKSTGGSR